MVDSTQLWKSAHPLNTYFLWFLNQGTKHVPFIFTFLEATMNLAEILKALSLVKASNVQGNQTVFNNNTDWLKDSPINQTQFIKSFCSKWIY